MSHHDYFFYFSQLSLLITETNEIDSDSMSGDLIIFITVYYINICILKAAPVFILTKKKRKTEGGHEETCSVRPIS